MKKKIIISLSAVVVVALSVLIPVLVYLCQDGLIITDSFYKSIITSSSFRKEIEKDKEYSFTKNGYEYFYVNVVNENNQICFKENGKIYAKTNYKTREFKFSNNLEFNIYYYALDNNSLTKSFSPGKEGYIYFSSEDDGSLDFVRDHEVGFVIENKLNEDVCVSRFSALA